MRQFFCFNCSHAWEAQAESSCPKCGNTIQVEELEPDQIVQVLYEADQMAEIAEQQAMGRAQR